MKGALLKTKPPSSLKGTLSEGLWNLPGNVGGKPCKLCHIRGDSLPQAVFTSPASIHHGFFCKQDCLVVRVLNHIVNEDGHALAQPHLKVLLMCNVAGLLAEMFHWQCFNHYWIGEQKEGIAIPLNPYMVDVVMGGEEIRDLHPWGGIRLPLSQPPDVVTAPQSLFFSRPGRLYWRKLGEDKVHEVDQSRQGDSGQKLPEQGKQCFRFVLQVSHTYQVNQPVTKLNFRVDGLSLGNGLLAHCQDFTPFCGQVFHCLLDELLQLWVEFVAEP